MPDPKLLLALKAALAAGESRRAFARRTGVPAATVKRWAKENLKIRHDPNSEARKLARAKLSRIEGRLDQALQDAEASLAKAKERGDIENELRVQREIRRILDTQQRGVPKVTPEVSVTGPIAGPCNVVVSNLLSVGDGSQFYHLKSGQVTRWANGEIVPDHYLIFVGPDAPCIGIRIAYQDEGDEQRRREFAEGHSARVADALDLVAEFSPKEETADATSELSAALNVLAEIEGSKEPTRSLPEMEVYR